MRKLLLIAPLLAVVVYGCESKTPVGPGIVVITETTTSTTTTTTTTSSIPEPTVAKFIFSPQTPEVGQAVRFDATDSVPGTGRTIVSYYWDLGDGTDAWGVKVVNDYPKSGVYLVTLTVTDDTGKTSRFSAPVTIRPATP